MFRIAGIFSLLLVSHLLTAQTLGGTTVFNFLNLSNTPQLTALGGINISNQSGDAGMAFNNPALLRSSMHSQVNCVFNAFYAGIKSYHLSGVYDRPKWKTVFSGGISYTNYGNIPETDDAGNILGSFKPVDYVVQLSAARRYLENWAYGGSLKFIHSAYGRFSSSGLALDFGISYFDTARLVQISIVGRNMGGQLKTYEGTMAGDLPFDVQAGISKKLAKAPVQFSLTWHHLHRFDITYSDPVFNEDNGPGSDGSFFDKFIRHIVIGAQVFAGDKIELSVGYNFLRRKELNVGSTGNGFNGMSFGAGVLLKKLQFRYARSYYQNNTAFNQVGISFRADQLLPGTRKR